MKFSDDRISHIAYLIHHGLREFLVNEQSSGFARDRESGGSEDARRDPPLRDDKAHREIKRTLIEYLKIEDGSDQAARDKISTLKRGVAEGSREWEVLYRKYFEEEMNKKGR